MFEYLSYLGNPIVGRYKTLENTIKCRSNSFYDSYLDLLEQTIKIILVNEDIVYNGRTCGEILREPDVINFALHKVNMSKDMYERCKNHIQKVNQHKHHKEKFITIDTVISYMNLYHDFVSSYIKYKGQEVCGFNAEELRAIYGITQKRSDELDIVKDHYDELTEIIRADLATLGKKVDALANGRTIRPVSSHEMSTPKANSQEILNRFLKTSNKSWRWFGNKKELNKNKLLLITATITMIIFGIISTVVTSICLGTYTSFLEDIGIVFAIVILTYGIKAKLLYQNDELARNSTTKYTKDKFGLSVPCKEKTIFKIVRWIAALAPIMNIGLVWWKQGSLNIVATVFELLFLASVIFVRYADVALFAQYTIIYFEGTNADKTEKVTLVWDPMVKKIVPEEEYKKQVPFLYN